MYQGLSALLFADGGQVVLNFRNLAIRLLTNYSPAELERVLTEFNTLADDAVKGNTSATCSVTQQYAKLPESTQTALGNLINILVGLTPNIERTTSVTTPNSLHSTAPSVTPTPTSSPPTTLTTSTTNTTSTTSSAASTAVPVLTQSTVHFQRSETEADVEKPKGKQAATVQQIEASFCVICQQRKQQMICFMPCHHIVVCQDCFNAFRNIPGPMKCPTCVELVTVYLLISAVFNVTTPPVTTTNTTGTKPPQKPKTITTPTDDASLRDDCHQE